MINKIYKFKNQPIPMIGRVWVFPEVIYVKDLEGEFGITGLELQRLQLAVANAICGEKNPLSKLEFEFLAEITQTSAKEIATILHCNLTSLVKWRKKDKVPPLESIFLKEFFWFKLFGDKVDFPNTQIGKERLAALAKAAIKQKVAALVGKKAA